MLQLSFTKKQLQAVTAVASRDITRENIRHVEFSCDGIVATDGHRLHRVVCDATWNDADGGIRAHILVDQAEKLQAFAVGKLIQIRIYSDGKMEIDSPSGWVDAAAFGIHNQVSLPAANWRQLPKGDDVDIVMGFDAKYLRDLADAALKACEGKKTVWVKFGIHSKDVKKGFFTGCAHVRGSSGLGDADAEIFLGMLMSGRID